jgi:hypothetical protein
MTPNFITRLAGLACAAVLCCGCCARAPEGQSPATAGAASADAPVAAAPAPQVAPQEATMPDTPAAPQTRPATNPRRFTGTLRGGILAVGAETTGWQLETADGNRVDVNVGKVQDEVMSLDGKRVIIEGTMTTARWVERGSKPLLMAERIEPAE